jgi:UDP-N-acetylmuramate--alanine ligase
VVQRQQDGRQRRSGRPVAHGHRHARAIMDEADLAQLVREQARPGDMVVCLGAGTISAWANALPQRLETEG